MKYLDEYRDPQAAIDLARAIAATVTQPWTIMEICGGQTHSIVRFGIDELLPPEITLVHGPGCPVCVTPAEMIDKAIEIASRPEVILCSFGDMLRVPGRQFDLMSVKAAGGDVRIVYSPMDAVTLAVENPDRQVVFFAVGFETTAPANGMAISQAKRLELTNFSVLSSHVLVPPAMEAILSSPRCRVQGFLAAGHVCAVMGFREYEPITRDYHVPIVVTGFEPVDILEGVLRCVTMLEEGREGVDNQYARAVDREGNRYARNVIKRVFKLVPRKWRGVGEIARSGLGLRKEYAEFDAELRYGPVVYHADDPTQCISGLVLQGVRKPQDCEAFGTVCTPQRPLGAPMVSSEGACAAYFRYRRYSAVSAA